MKNLKNFFSAVIILIIFAFPLISFANSEATNGAHHSDPIAPVLLGLIIILLAAKVGGELFEKMNQPAVLGELVFGMLIGNVFLLTGGAFSFGHLFESEGIDIMARLGVMILLFQVGLESNIKEMMKVGISSFLVAIIGVVAPMILGYFVSSWIIPEAGFNVHLFIGATLTATSVGITARVLKDLNKLNTPEAKIILGAAVVDDVLGLIILSIVCGIVISGVVSASSIAYISATSVIFLVGSILIGLWLSPKIGAWVSKMKVEGMKIVTAFLFLFVMSYLADMAGLATIVGAFAAGLVLDDVSFKNKREHHIEVLIKPLYCIFVPIFFVLMGIQVKLDVFLDPKIILIALGITAASIIGKQACGLGVRCKQASKLTVGIGMISRGEVGLIFAGVGKEIGVIDDSIFGAIVIMIILTTLVAPPLLKWSLLRGDENNLDEEIIKQPRVCGYKG
ncbi:MAG: cation:proton antiporter [Candidatus Pacebacteria bacterium]|nr:cation:proton antiporter [Candidatus Paceibacterota bacterium]